MCTLEAQSSYEARLRRWEEKQLAKQKKQRNEQNRPDPRAQMQNLETVYVLCIDVLFSVYIYISFYFVDFFLLNSKFTFFFPRKHVLIKRSIITDMMWCSFGAQVGSPIGEGMPYSELAAHRDRLMKAGDGQVSRGGREAQHHTQH